MNRQIRTAPRPRFTIGLVAALLCLVFGMGTALLAQTDTGRVNGTVTDSTGAIIPGATVTLKSTTPEQLKRRQVTAMGFTASRPWFAATIGPKPR